MKLKYQMRGLGIGIIVTSILMGVTTSHGIPLTDAEIMARASELGMVESSSLKLSDVGVTSTPAPESGKGEEGSPAPNSRDGEGQSGEGTSDGQDGEGQPGEGASDSRDGQEQSGEGESDGQDGEGQSGEGASDGQDGEGQPGEGASEEAEDSELPHVFLQGDRVMVTIESGMDSYTISLMLEEAGLVEDAGEFDNYLCDNAYSRKIVNGVYEIPVGTGEEEIAKIITRDR